MFEPVLSAFINEPLINKNPTQLKFLPDQAVKDGFEDVSYGFLAYE